MKQKVKRTEKEEPKRRKKREVSSILFPLSSLLFFSIMPTGRPSAQTPHAVSMNQTVCDSCDPARYSLNQRITMPRSRWLSDMAYPALQRTCCKTRAPLLQSSGNEAGAPTRKKLGCAFQRRRLSIPPTARRLPRQQRLQMGHKKLLPRGRPVLGPRRAVPGWYTGIYIQMQTVCK